MWHCQSKLLYWSCQPAREGFIIADPFIILTAVQRGSDWIENLHKQVVIFLHASFTNPTMQLYMCILLWLLVVCGGQQHSPRSQPTELWRYSQWDMPNTDQYNTRSRQMADGDDQMPRRGTRIICILNAVRQHSTQQQSSWHNHVCSMQCYGGARIAVRSPLLANPSLNSFFSATLASYAASW